MSFRSFLGAATVFASTLAAFSAFSPSVAAINEASAQQAGAASEGGGRPPWLEATNADAKSDDSKKSDAKKSDAKGDSKSSDSKKAGKPVQVGSFGDWGAFLAQGAKDKTCYALATPKARAPAALKRDPAYVFISNRPSEKVRNEVSIIMGFAIKDGGEARAEIGSANFDLVSKGSNAWIKNPAEETQFIEALKKGSKLVVKAPSVKGNVTVDSYSLAGISQALERVQKDCP
ncbi:MAG: hypothetical protein WDN46_13220 [Methylocella sp.]